MQNGFYFNAAGVEPNKAYEPLPAGEYPMHIIEAEMKEPRNGGEPMLSLTLEVLDGEYGGRRLWENLSINHEKDQVREIAQRQLSAICHAIETMELTDPQDLCFKPMMVKVSLSRRKDNGEWQNRQTYLIPSAAPAAQQKAAPAPSTARQTQNAGAAASRPATSPRPGKGSTPPWQRKAG